jgi:lipoprotein NlpD
MFHHRITKLFSVILLVLLLLSVAACNSSSRQKKYDYSSSNRSLPNAKYGTVYTVKRGDTLYSIAWAIKQDFRKVAWWNGISSPYVIHPGQRLRMYPPSQKTTKKSGTSPPQAAYSTKQKVNKPAKPKSYKSKAPQGKVKRWGWPTVSRKVVSRFHPTAGRDGIDISGRYGVAVYASADGQVVYAGSGLRGYGKLIIIKHNKTYLSAYAHNDSILVVEGQNIKAGKKIGRMGISGKGSATLHFEIRKNGKPVNPANYL